MTVPLNLQVVEWIDSLPGRGIARPDPVLDWDAIHDLNRIAWRSLGFDVDGLVVDPDDRGIRIGTHTFRTPSHGALVMLGELEARDGWASAVPQHLEDAAMLYLLEHGRDPARMDALLSGGRAMVRALRRYSIGCSDVPAACLEPLGTLLLRADRIGLVEALEAERAIATPALAHVQRAPDIRDVLIYLASRFCQYTIPELVWAIPLGTVEAMLERCAQDDERAAVLAGAKRGATMAGKAVADFMHATRRLERVLVERENAHAQG